MKKRKLGKGFWIISGVCLIAALLAWSTFSITLKVKASHCIAVEIEPEEFASLGALFDEFARREGLIKNSSHLLVVSYTTEDDQVRLLLDTSITHLGVLVMLFSRESNGNNISDELMDFLRLEIFHRWPHEDCDEIEGFEGPVTYFP